MSPTTTYVCIHTSLYLKFIIFSVLYELRNSIVEPYGWQNEIYLFLENMPKKKGNDTLKVLKSLLFESLVYFMILGIDPNLYKMI